MKKKIVITIHKTLHRKLKIAEHKPHYLQLTHTLRQSITADTHFPSINYMSWNSLICISFSGVQMQYLNIYTVRPVYKDHSREPENVTFMSSCALYTG